MDTKTYVDSLRRKSAERQTKIDLDIEREQALLAYNEAEAKRKQKEELERRLNTTPCMNGWVNHG